MSQYLLLEISLKKFNANSGFYTVGFPALTAFAGFFHNTQRKLNQLLKDKDIEGDLLIESFAILAKNVVVREGHPKYIKGLKSSEKFGIPASTVDEKNGDGDFCFIIKYKENIDNSSYSQLNSEVNNFAQLFEYLILNTKLAGGHFTIINKSKDGLFSNNDFIELNKKIKHKGYFYLVDESDELTNKNFDEYIELISKVSLKEKAELKEKPPKPYYVPIVSGFNLLENPIYKKNSILRNEMYPHAFAEPILSLGRFQSVYSVLYHYKNIDIQNEEELEKIILPKIFWDYKINNGLYYVAAQQYQN